jgi:predicted nuclease of predicted toxin-antitoxin system
MLSFYMDHNVHSAITDGLRLREINCLTTFQDGLARSDDQSVLSRATELGRVLFTQDRDFLEIAIEWIEAGRPFSGIIYAKQLRVTVGRAIMDLHLIAEVMTPIEMQGKVIHLPI